jgi:hypothetical protein
MSQKAESYLDESGKNWLVFYDRDGDKEYDTWTTNQPNNEFTHEFKIENEKAVVYVNFEIRKFPNGKYGYGYNTNIFYNDFEKCFTCINRSFDTELEALQHCWNKIKEGQKSGSSRQLAEKLIDKINQDLVPQSLF